MTLNRHGVDVCDECGGNKPGPHGTGDCTCEAVPAYHPCLTGDCDHELELECGNELVRAGVAQPSKKRKNKKAPDDPSPVVHPSHYGGDTVYEVIKVLRAWGLDRDAYLFNVVKYVARAGKKDPTKEIEDLEKAAYYLNEKIEVLKGNRS